MNLRVRRFRFPEISHENFLFSVLKWQIYSKFSIQKERLNIKELGNENCILERRRDSRVHQKRIARFFQPNSGRYVLPARGKSGDSPN